MCNCFLEEEVSEKLLPVIMRGRQPVLEDCGRKRGPFYFYFIRIIGIIRHFRKHQRQETESRILCRYLPGICRFYTAVI
jgi:hypothetical protein